MFLGVNLLAVDVVVHGGAGVSEAELNGGIGQGDRDGSRVLHVVAFRDNHFAGLAGELLFLFAERRYIVNILE